MPSRRTILRSGAAQRAHSVWFSAAVIGATWYCDVVLVPGSVIDGKYRVEKVIGKGGMGVVVSAWHLLLDQRVAIKGLLPGEGEMHQSLAARFQREARAAAKIRGENVCRVLDVGTMDDGHAYMVMEHLEGEDLNSLVRRRGRLPVDEAVEYVLQACAALAEAHLVGIVHRDVKPANLFLATTPSGRPLVKVLDFGISKMRESGPKGRRLTEADTILGSVGFMSIEQLKDAADVDARSDVWSLGVLLHKLISGKMPFPCASLADALVRITSDAPERLRVAAPHVPAALEAVVLRCLERDINRRYSDVLEFAHDLAPFTPRGELLLDRIPVEKRLSVEMPNIDAGAVASDERPSTKGANTAVTTDGGAYPAASPGREASAPSEAPTAIIQPEHPSVQMSSNDRATPDPTGSRRPPSGRLYALAAVLFLALGGAGAFAMLSFSGETSPASTVARPEPAAVSQAPSASSVATSDPAPSVPAMAADSVAPAERAAPAATTASPAAGGRPVPTPGTAAAARRPVAPSASPFDYQ